MTLSEVDFYLGASRAQSRKDAYRAGQILLLLLSRPELAA